MSIKGLKLQGGTYYAYVVVPTDVQALFPKKSMWATTGTGDLREAAKIGPRLRAEMKVKIAQARERLRNRDIPPDRTLDARIALAAWASYEAAQPVLDAGSIHPDWLTLAQTDALQKAADDPFGYLKIDGFDGYLAGLLTAHGCVVSIDDPVIPLMRQEAALTLLYAVKFQERARRANAFMRKAREAANSDLEAMHIVPAKVEPPLPAPSITISALFAEWLATVKPTDKQMQRFEHQKRRLIEFTGDRAANHLRRKDITEFMGLVVRFPGRKRSAELAALPMAKLVERFEAENVKLVAQGFSPLPTLSETTAGDWFDGFRRCWAYGVAMEHVETNPWDGLRNFVVTGGKPVIRRAYTDEEIKFIFTRPLFTGHLADSNSYRDKPGPIVTKDARYWLPILSLFHGQRLTEFAALPLADVAKTIEGTWYFDLTRRPVGRQAEGSASVKTETSQRFIPLHPELCRLGFPAYVAAQQASGQVWLFPDLDHQGRFGPGHEISKWWGRWMDKNDLNDPSISMHSFRHGFKRHARATPDVKEEMHDILSGHKGLNSVSRRYGEGAPIEALARDMAKIQFPAFPI